MSTGGLILEGLMLTRHGRQTIGRAALGPDREIPKRLKNNFDTTIRPGGNGVRESCLDGNV